MRYTQVVHTPEGPLSMVRTVAEKLLKEGVITGDLDGTLRAGSAATVKAAVMTHGVCDFCSAPGPTHRFDVPDFDMPSEGVSTGGWASCDTCAELVQAGNQKALLARSVNTMAYPKFTHTAVEELHKRFWNGMALVNGASKVAKGLADFIENRLPSVSPMELDTREKRLRAIAAVVGLTREELEQVIRYQEPVPLPVITKLLLWWSKYGDTKKPSDARAIAALFDPVVRPPLRPVLPHWQEALDRKFEAVATLQDLMKAGGDGAHFFPEAVDLKDNEAVKRMVRMAHAKQELKDLGIADDLRLLRQAQAYSFSADTEAAILEAARSIPHDMPLSSIEAPNAGAGWFWFSRPLEVAASPAASAFTHALLWAWGDTAHGPSLLFSAYVLDELDGKRSKTFGKLVPSTRWHWPWHMTFHEMLGLCAEGWRKNYGPGTALEHDQNVVGLEPTLKVIADLSMFFAMACVWFRQTVPGQPKRKVQPVLTQEAGHVERHARKRYEREHKLPDRPTVQVVALRKSARVEAAGEAEPRAAGTREYHCRWIVQGHARLQPVGPGRKERKLIWIEAHPAGPEDKPLKTKTKVYAVVR